MWGRLVNDHWSPLVNNWCWLVNYWSRLVDDRSRLVNHWPRSSGWWRWWWDVGGGCSGGSCSSSGGRGCVGGGNGRMIRCWCWGGWGWVTPVSLDESGSGSLCDVSTPEDDHVGVVLIDTVKDWKAG